MQERSNEVDLTRRGLVKGLGVFGVAVATGLTPELPKKPQIIDPTKEIHQVPIKQLIDEGTAARDQLELETYHSTPLDWAGAAWFAKGVTELLPKGRGHIGLTEYAGLGALIKAKYDFGDDHTKQHIQDELESSLVAALIIGGSATAAQGIRLDVNRAYQEKYAVAPRLEDKVALATMASAVISPMLTTVSAAAAFNEEAHQIAREVWQLKHPGMQAGEKDLDHPTVAALIDHISNASGFILFGDPPWIAMMEKYGFKEAVKYQFETMLPMALMSLFMSNVNINRQIIAAESGNSEISPSVYAEAIKRSSSALYRNLPFLSQILGLSLANLVGYSNVDGTGKLLDYKNQNPKGFQYSVFSVVREKLTNVIKVLANDKDFKFPLHDPEAFSGITTEHFPELEAMEEVIGSRIIDLIDDDAHMADKEVSHFLDHEQYDELEQYLIEKGKPAEIELVEILKRFSHDKADQLIRGRRSFLSKALETLVPGIGGYYERINHHRIHNAIGANLTDVFDVFPFQAGSVIFLAPVFQDVFTYISKKMDTVFPEYSIPKEVANDLMVYLAIMGFSTFADNYVAEKLGLELKPEKPELITAAAIRGGTNLSPLSNMADPTLFSTNVYGMADAAKQMFRGVDQHVIGFIWSEMIDKFFRPLGFFEPPTPLNQAVPAGAH